MSKLLMFFGYVWAFVGACGVVWTIIEEIIIAAGSHSFMGIPTRWEPSGLIFGLLVSILIFVIPGLICAGLGKLIGKKK